MTEFNQQVIAEFRANKGVVGGFFAGANLVLLHHRGHRTGQERLTPLLYLADGEDLVLIGSAGGDPKEPAWVANLAAVTETVVEVGEQTLTVRPEVLREGPERARIYERFVAYWPDVLEYEKKTDRSFPLVKLSPV